MPGIFATLGIRNGSDLVNDTVLQYRTSGDEFPIVEWEVSSDSNQYAVTIFENDGVTIKCARQTTTATFYNFLVCPLNPGSFYKVHIESIGEGLQVRSATNSPFSFFVNRMPVGVTDSPTVPMDSVLHPIGVIANDTDPDGHAVSLVSVSTPLHGNASVSGNSVNYTPTPGYFGADTFSYTLADALGGQATGVITVTVQNAGGLAISSAAVSISHGRSWKFTASGGTAPYSFSVSGGGAINASTGLYESSKKGGYTASVTVTDSALATSVASVQVKPIPSFTFCIPTWSETGQSLYGVMYDSGGAGSDYQNDQDCEFEIYWDKNIPITFDANPDLAPGDEFWAGDFSTPMNSIYPIDSTPLSTTFYLGRFYTYFYSDNAGTAPGGELLWYPEASLPMTLLASETSLFLNDSRVIDVINGVGPFTFQIVSGSGNLVATSWNDQIQFVSTSTGVTVVKATDATNAESFITLTVLPLGLSTVTLNNCPLSPSPLQQILVNASGVDVTSIKYKVVNSSVDCSLDQGYSSEQSTVLPILHFLDWYPSQKLCVLSKNATYGWLPLSSASSCSWTKELENYPKIEFSKSIQIISESNTSLTARVMTTIPVQRDTTVNYIVGGSATPSTDHNLVSGSVIIPTGQSQVDINFLVFDNAVTESEKTIILSLSSQNNTDATFGGRVEHQVLIKDDETVPGATVSKLSVGSRNSCVVLSNGEVKCWGENRYGQLATGTTYTTSATPITVFGSDGADVQISISPESHICSTKTDGSLWCWGQNSSGQVGDNSTSTRLFPVQIFASGISQFALGFNSTCAVLSTGELKCWGLNSSGQLGDGTTNERRVPTSTIASDVLKVGLGIAHTCALKTGGEVWCWGRNTNGQIGDGTTDQSLIPIKVIASGALDLTVGWDETCALFAGGELKCWGSLMGVGIPTVVVASGAASSVIGNSTICALMQDSSIQCRGANSYRIFRTDDQYGSWALGGFVAYSMVSLNESGFSKIAHRDRHMCGLKTDGSLLCWGANDWGQLGKPSTTYWAPRKIEPSGYQKIAGDKFGTMCGLTAGGALDCWGTGESRSLSSWVSTSLFIPNQTVASLNVPIRIYNSDIQDVQMGDSTICVIKTTGALECWGLVQGVNQLYPKTLFSSGVTKASLSSDNSCAVFTSGELKCWSGYYRGDGAVNDPLSHDPVTIFASGVKDVSTKAGLTCAVFTDGSVKCWGNSSYYRLGDGFNVSRVSPVEIIASGVDSVSVGSSAACALFTTTGQLKCWGANQFGAVGDGTVAHKSTPTTIFASGVKQVMSADSQLLLSHTCILQGNDTIQCFGTSRNGQIGNGNWTDYVISPYTVGGVSNATSIITFGDRSCAIVTGGDIYCWGDNKLNAFGQSSPPTWYNYVTGL